MSGSGFVVVAALICLVANGIGEKPMLSCAAASAAKAVVSKSKKSLAPVIMGLLLLVGSVSVLLDPLSEDPI